MDDPLEVTNALDGAATLFLAAGSTLPDARTFVDDIRKNVTWFDGEAFTPVGVAFIGRRLKSGWTVVTQAFQ